MTSLATLFAIVFAFHLAPAFTPPTWPVIVLYLLQRHTALPLTVVTAAVAATLGRLTLALGTRLLADRLPARFRQNLLEAHNILERKRGSKWIIHGLFLVGSASEPLFEAAALARLRLPSLALAYFVGRLPRYTLYALAAGELPKTEVWRRLSETTTRPDTVATEVACLLLVLALIVVRWGKWSGRR